jgi:large subunit ribosomal protein L6
MSRLGKLPVALPEKVEVKIESNSVTIKGPKGELKTSITGDVNVTLDSGEVWVKPANDTQRARAMWGTVRANIFNIVKGVTEGYTRVLEINGVGYRCSVAGNVLSLSLGFSHEIKYVMPAGVSCAVDKQTVVTLTGADKQKVGQVASEIRALRKPEPYKGKGVKYAEEKVRRKEGKKK